MRWNFVVKTTIPQVGDELTNFYRRCPEPVSIVDLQTGSFGACSLAFGSMQGEHAVVGGATFVDAKFFFCGVHEIVCTQ